jgi:Fe-S-cluster-containing dehydrogenase component
MNAILTDITKCVGCNECIKACKKINKLPADKPRFWQKMTDFLQGIGLLSFTMVNITFVNSVAIALNLPVCRFVPLEHCTKPILVLLCMTVRNAWAAAIV